MNLSKPFVVQSVVRASNGSGNLYVTSTGGAYGYLTFQGSPQEVMELKGKTLTAGTHDGGNPDYRHLIYLGDRNIAKFLGPKMDPKDRYQVNDISFDVHGGPGSNVEREWFREALKNYPGEKKAPDRLVLSIDIETTGLDPTKCQTLQVAVVPILNGVVQVGPENTLNTWIKHPGYYLEPGVAGNARFLENVRLAEAQGEDPGTALYRIRNYLQRWRDKYMQNPSGMAAEAYQKFTVIGKNFLGVDGPFLKALGVEGWYFHHRVIDVAGLVMRPTDVPPPGMEEVLKRGGQDFSEDTLHDALVDATAVASVYSNWYHGRIGK